jgi:hypothetical protein
MIIQISRLAYRLSQLEFHNFIEQLFLVKEILSKLPERSTLYELYQINPEKLRLLLEGAYPALFHSCEAVLGLWAFQHSYKFKASFRGFNYGLEDGNFLVAFSCARAMFEEVAHFHFHLVRIEASHAKAAQLWKQAAPGFLRRKPPSENWTKSFVTALLEIVHKAVKSIQGSDYDWNGWFQHQLGNIEVKTVDISEQITSHAEFRKTHINDCLSELEKKSQLNATKVYSLLSEMVHPNFGSNTLVIATRNRVSDLAGDVVLSRNPRNVEAAAWFFELASGPLSRIFELERDYMSRSQALLRFYQDAARTSQLSPTVPKTT